MQTREFLIIGTKNGIKLLDSFPTLEKAKAFIKTHIDGFEYECIIEYKYGKQIRRYYEHKSSIDSIRRRSKVK